MISMALTNSSKHAPFQVLSQLSVDAASFIPCQPGPPVYEISLEQQTQRTSSSAMPPSTTNQLPSYVVNCYPFMDIDPNTRFPGGGMTLSPDQMNIQRKLVNGHIPSLILQKPPALVNEGNPFHVDVQWPPPLNHNLMTPSFLSPSVNNPPLQMPVFGHMPPQPRTTAAYTNAPTMGHPLPQAYLGISPSLYGYNQSLQYIQGLQVPSYMYSSSTQTQGVWFPPGQEKSEDKTVKSQPKTKVIVCKDNSAQTDFNDELAQLTLAEKPNTLFINDQTTAQGVDSDSGYSSPLHRKNQTTGVRPSTPRPSTFRPPPAPSLPPPPPQATQVASQNPGYSPLTGPMYHHVFPPFPFPQFPGIVYPSPMYGSGESIMSQQFSLVNQFPGMIANDQRPRPREKQKSFRRASDGKSSVPVSRPGPGSVTEFVSRPQPTTCDDASCPVRASTAPSGDQDGRLPFEDEDEFPILLSAAGGLVAQGECFGSSSLSYGEILRGPSSQSTSRSRRSSASSSDKRRSTGSLPLNGGAGALVPGLAASKDSKSARKKQKRQLLAYQAAEDELAEICLEQQMLKELSTKQQKRQLFTVTDKAASVPKVPPPPPPALPLAETPPAAPPVVAIPMAVTPLFNIEDVIEQLEKEKSIEERSETVSPSPDSLKMTSVLDSNGTAKRAKDREFPNKKKPSSLKRVILKEREAKKCHSILDDCSSHMPDGTGSIVNGDVTQNEGGGLLESLPANAPTSAEMSPVSQMSPINMSPLSGSPAGSAGASPIAGDGTLGSGKSSVLSKIHSRRFREYCNQVLDKEIDDCCTELLQDLVRFQDRLYHDDPTKAKSKRRFVLGLREVTKHLKLGKLKCIIISPNLERIQSKGGLDDALNAIIEMSQKQDVPFVFALGRRALGRACAKLVPVSVVGVFSYEGSEENFFKLRDLTQKARDAYSDMVTSLEREMAAAEPPATNIISTTAGSFEKLFPHLGHSRTPSACSAISFISSILSEPISENYPQSEPETDSRGYEIRLENRKPDLDTVGEGREETVEPEAEDKKAALNDEDIDDGHEADTEEDGLYSNSQQTDNPVARDSKEKIKSEPEPTTDFASKLDPQGPTSAVIAVRSEVACSGHLAMSTIEPGATNGSTKGSMSTSERSERIESWVAESQRVTKQLRELSSSEAPASAVNADEEEESGGEEEEEEEEEVDEDAASLKTVEDGSSSEYEETVDVPFGDDVVASP